MPIDQGAKPKVHRRLLSDEVHDHIRDAVLSGTFAPGEVLEDAALQEWLGVSRTPIRDALKRLQYEGLVVIQAQSSTRVANPDTADVEESLQAFGAVMGGVVRITVPELTEVQRDQLLDLIAAAQQKVIEQDAVGHLDATLLVYEALLEDCSNAALVRIARTSLMPLAFGYRASLATRVPDWDLLISGWGRFRAGITTRDNILAELAIEEMHRLPLPDLDWDSAVWSQNDL